MSIVLTRYYIFPLITGGDWTVHGLFHVTFTSYKVKKRLKSGLTLPERRRNSHVICVSLCVYRAVVFTSVRVAQGVTILLAEYLTKCALNDICTSKTRS